MASQLKVDTITGVTTAGSIAVTGEGNSTTTNLQQGLCKHWANLNGSGTIALRDSHNTSSTTDNGTGDYTFNFTSSYSSASYTIVGMPEGDGSGLNRLMAVHSSGTAETSALYRVKTSDANAGSSAGNDRSRILVNTMGDLA